MRRVAQFFFVSSAQLQADWPEALGPCPDASELRLPRRATAGSAGYDFFSPCDFVLAPGQTVLLPTGVRARMDEGLSTKDAVKQVAKLTGFAKNQLYDAILKG